MDINQLFPKNSRLDTEAAFTNLNINQMAKDDRPYVICNMISTLDGKATIDGRAGPISNPADREIFHLLRTQADCLLVGAGTVRIERYGRPTKNSDLAAIRVRDSVRTNQLVCIPTNSMQLDSQLPLLTDPSCEVIVYTTSAVDPPQSKAELSVIRLDGSEVDLQKTLYSLREVHGIESVICEGGPTLNGKLLRAGLIDELFLSLSPQVVAGSGLPSIVEGPAIEHGAPMNLVEAFESEGSLFLRYRFCR